MKDCELGKIDLIITKSITRFARNTVDSIEAIRKLKLLGIAVFFEKENINTLSENSEQLLSILSSLAQGEAESTSTNNKWSIIKRFKKGTYIIGTPALGYTNNEEGELVIEEQEVEIVRYIFKQYLNGKGSYAIAKELNDKKIPTIRDSEKWVDGVVKEILKNPVYAGDLLLQKHYTTEVVPFKQKRNKGEVPQYFISNNHEPIISREESEAVKEIYEYRRKQMNIDGEKSQNRYAYSSKIICGECGKVFRRQCKNSVFRKPGRCKCGTVIEEQIKEIYILEINKVIKMPNLLEKKTKEIPRKYNPEFWKLDQKIKELEEDEQFSSKELSVLIFQRASAFYQSVQVYDYEHHTENLKQILSDKELQTEFQEELFLQTIKQMVIYADGHIDVGFSNGVVVSEKV